MLLCLICLFDLACFFLSFFLLISHLKTRTCTCIYVHTSPCACMGIPHLEGGATLVTVSVHWWAVGCRILLTVGGFESIIILNLVHVYTCTYIYIYTCSSKIFVTKFEPCCIECDISVYVHVCVCMSGLTKLPLRAFSPWVAGSDSHSLNTHTPSPAYCSTCIHHVYVHVHMYVQYHCNIL